MDTSNPALVPPNEISYQRCAACKLMGADLLVPESNRLVCGEVCLGMVRNEGPSANAVPSSQQTKSNLMGVIHRCSQLDPVHIVDATLWLAMEGRNDAPSRVTKLHAAMVDINRNRGGPYSHMPLPLDPNLYNIHATYARYFASRALQVIVDVPGEKEEDILANIREQRSINGESEARAHALALWLTYGVFWRHYLHDYDWEMYCALSDSDRVRVSNLLPHNPPPPVPTTKVLVSADTYASLKRLKTAVDDAVNLLFNQLKLSKDMIQAYLVNGLFANVAPETFETRPINAPESELEADEVIQVQESKKLLSIAQTGLILSQTPQRTNELIDKMTLHEGQFIAAVTDSHANILSWARARFDRTVNRVKGFTSRAGYDVVTLADRLYQLAVANKCNGGAIARTSGLVISPLNLPAYTANSAPREQWFSGNYSDAFQRQAIGLDITLWKKDYDAAVAATSYLARREENRNERIKSYTCFNSKSVAIPPSRWQQLPTDIATQLVAMGRYMYMTDQSSGVKADARQKRVKDDIAFLIKEVSRKVGSDDMSVLLTAISPPALRVL